MKHLCHIVIRYDVQCIHQNTFAQATKFVPLASVLYKLKVIGNTTRLASDTRGGPLMVESAITRRNAAAADVVARGRFKVRTECLSHEPPHVFFS